MTSWHLPRYLRCEGRSKPSSPLRRPHAEWLARLLVIRKYVRADQKRNISSGRVSLRPPLRPIQPHYHPPVPQLPRIQVSRRSAAHSPNIRPERDVVAAGEEFVWLAWPCSSSKTAFLHTGPPPSPISPTSFSAAWRRSTARTTLGASSPRTFPPLFTLQFLSQTSRGDTTPKSPANWT
jgi:hypothetical protein